MKSSHLWDNGGGEQWDINRSETPFKFDSIMKIILQTWFRDFHLVCHFNDSVFVIVIETISYSNAHFHLQIPLAEHHTILLQC